MTKFPVALLATAFLTFSISAVSAASHSTPQKMQERGMQMEKMMKQAEQAKTPAERQKLMADHMQTMQLQMAAMRDMMGPDGMMARHHDGSAMDPEASSQMQMKMQAMMQHTIEMMEMMMQHQPNAKPAP